MRKAASKEKNLIPSNCESLFLAHPTYGNECSTSEDLQKSREVGSESSKSPTKSKSWNNPSRPSSAVLPTMAKIVGDHFV